MPITRRALLAAAGLAGVCPPRLRAAGAPLQRRLVRGGLAVPVVGLGTWQAFDVGVSGDAADAARATLARFVEDGGRLVDSSPMYGRAEAAIGRLGADLGVLDRLVVATKIWTRGRAEGRRQLADSHAKLRREVLDLVQIHNLLDAETHLATLREARDAGRVRHIGVTHYVASAHDELADWCRRPEVETVQVNYSLAEREADRRLLGVAAEHGVGVLVNRALGGGALFGRVRGKALPGFAAEIGCSSFAQIFIKWVLGHPAVSCVLTGTRNPRHVADNLAAAALPLPDAAMRARIAAWFDAL